LTDAKTTRRRVVLVFGKGGWVDGHQNHPHWVVSVFGKGGWVDGQQNHPHWVISVFRKGRWVERTKTTRRQVVLVFGKGGCSTRVGLQQRIGLSSGEVINKNIKLHSFKETYNFWGWARWPIPFAIVMAMRDCRLACSIVMAWGLGKEVINNVKLYFFKEKTYDLWGMSTAAHPPLMSSRCQDSRGGRCQERA